MADIKVSGLTAVAAALTTHELPVNEAGTSKKVTIAQIFALLPQGTLSGGYAQAVASQGGITTVVDLTSLTVTVTPLAGRRIKITGSIIVQSTVANDAILMRIQEGATVLHGAQMHVLVINQDDTLEKTVILQPTASAHTYKLTLQRAAGTGTITMSAAGTQPAFILVEDIGT